MHMTMARWETEREQLREAVVVDVSDVIFAIEDTDHNRVHFKPQKVPHPRSGAGNSKQVTVPAHCSSTFDRPLI